MIKTIVRRIVRQLSTAIYTGQEALDRVRLLRPYRDVAAMMDEIEQKIAGIQGQ